MQRNFTVWPVLDKAIWPTPQPPTDNTYEKEILSLKDWIAERMNWLDEQLGFYTTGITLPQESVGKVVSGYYNLQGVKQERPERGPVIVRYNDGTSRVVNMK